jgi:ubiquinone/menaquinone biosynthesis C-methylase UbiE
MDSQNQKPAFLDEAIYNHYSEGREQSRLSASSGKLEFVRTLELVRRYLPPAPVTIYDIGGGAGIYALPLAQLGYEVHLLDAMPLHIEQAAAEAKNQPEHPLASLQVGNARHLDFADASADAVLLFGPLYHLTEKEERIQALREANRVLKPGGLVFTAVISRFAPLMDGLSKGFLTDSYFVEILERSVTDGQHRNPQNRPGYFSTAYFYHPSEIKDELTEADFNVEAVLAIEGPAEFMPNFDAFWEVPSQRELLLGFVRKIEADPSMLGASGHIMGVGRKA